MVEQRVVGRSEIYSLFAVLACLLTPRARLDHRKYVYVLLVAGAWQCKIVFVEGRTGGGGRKHGSRTKKIKRSQITHIITKISK